MIVVKETDNGLFDQINSSTVIIGDEGIQHSWQIIDLWDDDELAALGIYRVDVPVTPEGKVQVSYTIERVGGIVSYVPVYEDIPEPEVVIPYEISRRQFYQQLAIQEIITEDAAIASNGGVIPEPLLDLVAQLPEEDQFNARMLLSGAATFFRDHPLTIAIGTARGFTSEMIDEFFVAADALG